MRNGKSGELVDINGLFLTLYFHREVSVDDGEKKAKEYGVMFIETSAKAGHNVSDLTICYYISEISF